MYLRRRSSAARREKSSGTRVKGYYLTDDTDGISYQTISRVADEIEEIMEETYGLGDYDMTDSATKRNLNEESSRVMNHRRFLSGMLAVIKSSVGKYHWESLAEKAGVCDTALRGADTEAVKKDALAGRNLFRAATASVQSSVPGSLPRRLSSFTGSQSDRISAVCTVRIGDRLHSTDFIDRVRRLYRGRAEDTKGEYYGRGQG